MRRREFLASMAGAPALVRARSPGRPPNVVVTLCDDLGYGDLGCFGHATIRTPNLDRLASEGVRFTDCYAAAPVCSPSRAGLLTGRTPDRAGVYDWIPEGSPMHLRREEVSVAKILKSAGYATCLAGKWHLAGALTGAQPTPGEHGFDHWFATQNNAAPSHENPENFVRNGKPAGKLRGYSSALIVEEALAWLGGLDRARPFCLFVCFHAPHEPIATAEEFTGMYPLATKRGQALYYGNVTQMDHEFGRLMAALDRRGDRENTFVLFTSDNGPEKLERYPAAWRSHGSAGHLRGMKLQMYEGGYRIPGIVRWPGRARAGQVCREPICGVDLLPTLCALAEVKPPSNPARDGANFLPALAGRRVPRAAPLHWHYHNAEGRPKASLRDGDWKILGIPAVTAKRTPGSAMRPIDMATVKSYELDSFELYNLRPDPGETRDLAQGEPKRLRAMAERLVQLHREVRAEGPAW